MNEFLPIGLDKLSESINLNRGELVTIAGRPNFGKTSLVSKMVYNLATTGKYKIGMFSLEWPAHAFAKMILGKRTEKEELKDYTNEIGTIYKNRLWIDDTPGITIAEIRNKCYAMKKMYGGIDYVFIDYVQLISADVKHESPVQERAAIARSLKELAGELDCVIVVASQLARKIDKWRLELRPNKSRRPCLQDLGDMGMEQDTDVALFLYRDEIYHRDSSLRGKVEMIIGKNRNGPTGETFMFDLNNGC